MNASTDTLPKSIVDKILVQADIDALLNDEPYEELHQFDPHSLTPVQHFYESKFNRGIKEPASASKPLKKAYRSMFVSEVNVLGMKNNRLNGLCLTDEPYIKVKVPGQKGDVYIETSRLKQLLKEFEADEYTIPYDGGIALVKLLCIDKQLLLDNCEMR